MTVTACAITHDPVRANTPCPRVATTIIQMIGDHAIPAIMGRPVFINRFLVSGAGKIFIVILKKEAADLLCQCGIERF
jgi:hypothetical protein